MRFLQRHVLLLSLLMRRKYVARVSSRSEHFVGSLARGAKLKEELFITDEDIREAVSELVRGIFYALSSLQLAGI